MPDADERVLTRQGLDRQAELLEHAERLFMERGYADTRMVDIAKAAGVAKGLVYWYFDSKQALFREIIQKVRDQLRATQAAALAGIEEPLDRLFVGMRTSVEFVAEHWQVYFQLFSVDPAFGREISESSRVHAGDTLALVEAGQDDGTIRTDETAASLVHASQGVVNQTVLAHLRGKVGPLSDAADSAARFVIRTVAADPAVADAVIGRRTR